MRLTWKNSGSVAIVLGVCLAMLVCRSAHAQQKAKQAKGPPNIVLIMADDVGFSDVGCYGGEIETPNVDRLAAGGLRFTQFYNNSVCVTTRASLLTGLYPRRIAGRASPRLTPNMVTLGEVLREAGYNTVLSGKWHLGRTAPHRPIDRGFDEYYGLLDGCCNYFNPVQRDPPFEGGRIRVWGHNDRLVTKFPADFYSTDAISDHAAENIRRLAKQERPFFVHVCYTAAHSPLHAKPQDIAKYKGRYDEGWEKLRRDRHRRQIELGVIDSKWKLPSYEREVCAWEDEPNKKWQCSLMEVYAAMVDSMDQGIGRILQAIDESGAHDNTVVMFLSDNGGCAEQAGGDDVTNIPGPKEHYVSCGAGWAFAQNTPFRRYKAWEHEAGIATPLVVYWPGVVKAGSMTHEVGHIIDFMPTLIEIAGTEYPQMFAGHEILPVEGQSLMPIFHGQRREGHEQLFWEWSGNRAARQGRWKIAWDFADPTGGRWELYDMQEDRTETNDLAQRYPERLRRMAADWTEWSKRTGVAQLKPRPIRLGPR